MIHIFKFNLLESFISYSKGTYLINKRSLKMASKHVIATIQNITVFVLTKHTQIRI